MNQEVKLPKEVMIVSETNEKGFIKYANKDFCDVSGYTMEELLNQPHSYVRHQDMPSAAFEDLWKTIKAGNIWKGIVKNKTKSGNYYWVNATAYPSKTKSGELRYISVRVKPTDEEIQNAENLYKKLNQGK